MKSLKKHLVAAVALAPVIALAQAPVPPAEPAKPGEQPPTSTAPAAPPAAVPAAPAAKPAEPTVKVTPYGFVQLSAYFDQNTFANKDYPGQVARDQSGGAFLMSARYSRFGVKLALDDKNWTGAKLGGEIEFDFKAGHLPTATQYTTTCTAALVCTTTAAIPSTTWYNGVMRLRLADMTATWKTPAGAFTILAGQNYGIVNPLFATTITWTADPLFWMAGNVWRRAPQIRATYALPPEMLGFNLAVDMIEPQTADGVVDFGSGNRSRLPDFEGRAGINAAFGSGATKVGVAAGVGYLFNRRRIDNPASPGTTKDIDGHLLGVDASITSQFLDIKGEYFSQQAAGDTYNAIAFATGTAAQILTDIKSDGFWAQGILKPIPEVWITGGYGQEEVNKPDLQRGLRTQTSVRSKNNQTEFGLILNAGKYWKFGVEGIQTTTTYVDGKKVDGRQLAVSTQFIF